MDWRPSSRAAADPLASESPNIKVIRILSWDPGSVNVVVGAARVGELGAHLGELGVAFFAGEFGGVVRIEAVPAGEILAVEERAETGGWLGLGGAEDGEGDDGEEREDEPSGEAERGEGRGNGEVHGVLGRGCA